MPATPQTVVKATLTPLPGGSAVTVHFNPASLTYSVENTVSQQSGGPKKSQYVAQFSGKLSMDLQFDSTNDGSDVRIATNAVATFMQSSANASAAAQNAAPSGGSGGASSTPPKAAPVLSFQWGTYEFRGVMESFKETIDFFSADGVALRALVSITLARQDQVFDEGANFSQANTGGSLVPTSGSDSALSVATRGGDPSAARSVASDNGLETPRFTGGAQLQIGAGVQLNASAGFAAGASASAGASFGGSFGASATFAGSFGATASAGVPASAGAFAGLAVGSASVTSSANLDPTQIIASTSGADVTFVAGTRVALSGAASAGASPGLSADVGATMSFSSRLTFDSDD
ncbi:MAG TPA: hypothetical protein VHT53_03710 [Candidatus Elarobacter sp.]|jgi:hypothetical protein|nr:hypothetical protein [Candidatus Elarobacter sp.]